VRRNAHAAPTCAALGIFVLSHGEASSSRRALRTWITARSRSTSSWRRATISPRRRPTHPPMRMAARYFGGLMASTRSTRATSWAGVAMHARTRPVPRRGRSRGEQRRRRQTRAALQAVGRQDPRCHYGWPDERCTAESSCVESRAPARFAGRAPGMRRRSRRAARAQYGNCGVFGSTSGRGAWGAARSSFGDPAVVSERTLLDDLDDAGTPACSQQPNTDQQMSFRIRWSSSTSSRIASGSWSRCHRHSSCPALSPSPAGAAARAALIA
jgi:hypothetical protein